MMAVAVPGVAGVMERLARNCARVGFICLPNYFLSIVPQEEDEPANFGSLLVLRLSLAFGNYHSRGYGVVECFSRNDFKRFHGARFLIGIG